MPRGVRRDVNYKSEISELEKRISVLKVREAKLSQQLKDLLDKEQNHELNEISQLIRKSGVSIKDLKNMLPITNTQTNSTMSNS